MAKKDKSSTKHGAHAAQTPAIAACVDAEVTHTVHQFPHTDRDFGAEAAHCLGETKGIEADRIFKTLIIELHGKSAAGSTKRLAVAVVPVTDMLNLKAAAAALGASKADMADPHDAQRSSGYVPGGISPLGQRKKLPTVIDESALLCDTMFVSGGRRGWDIELSPESLITLCDAVTAPITAA